MPPTCRCACHHEAQGNYRAAQQLDRWTQIMDASRQPTLNTPFPVDVHDATEAAVACDVCRQVHCPALQERRIWWDQVLPAPLPVRLASATYEDSGEGPED